MCRNFLRCLFHIRLVDLFLQMILSFELPFALIPLLKFTSSKAKMGQYANSIAVKPNAETAINATVLDVIILIRVDCEQSASQVDVEVCMVISTKHDDIGD